MEKTFLVVHDDVHENTVNGILELLNIKREDVQIVNPNFLLKIVDAPDSFTIELKPIPMSLLKHKDKIAYRSGLSGGAIRGSDPTL